MTLVEVLFVLIFAVVQLSAAEYVVYGCLTTIDDRQPVTEPKPMSSTINYPAELMSLKFKEKRLLKGDVKSLVECNNSRVLYSKTN